MRVTDKAIVHNLGNPQPPARFDTLHAALQYARAEKLTGYINIHEPGFDPEIINIRKGKRKGLDGKWVPCA